MEVYLYNEAENDWYVHHDYILDVPPLCLEPIYFDPGNDDKKGNLLAVGGIDASISIWDLDLVNSVEPTVVLGKAKDAKRFFFFLFFSFSKQFPKTYKNGPFVYA